MLPRPMYHAPFILAVAGGVLYAVIQMLEVICKPPLVATAWVAAHAVLCLSSAWRPRAASGRHIFPLFVPCTAYRACTMYHVPCTKYHLYTMYRAACTVYRVPCGALIVYFFFIFFHFFIVVVRNTDDDAAAVFF